MWYDGDGNQWQGLLAIMTILTLPVRTTTSDQQVMETITDPVPFNEKRPKQ